MYTCVTLTYKNYLKKIKKLLTCPASAADWFIKGSAMCYHVYMKMHGKHSYPVSTQRTYNGKRGKML